MIECLRVSDIIGCQRALYYKALGLTQLNPMPKAYSGTELHNAIDNYIKFGTVPKKWEFEENIKAWNNFISFTKSIPSVKEYVTETRLFNNTVTPPYSGKPDLRMDKYVFDWKSGNYFQKKYFLQMSGYASLFKCNEIEVWGYSVVMLGGYRPEIHCVDVNIKEFEKYYKQAKFTCELADNSKDDDTIKIPEPEVSMICGYCSYIHHCRGLKNEVL